MMDRGKTPQQLKLMAEHMPQYTSEKNRGGNLNAPALTTDESKGGMTSRAVGQLASATVDERWTEICSEYQIKE